MAVSIRGPSARRGGEYALRSLKDTATATATPSVTAAPTRKRTRLSVSLWMLQILCASLVLLGGYLRVTRDPSSVAGFVAVWFDVPFVQLIGALDLASVVGPVLGGLTGLALTALVAVVSGSRGPVSWWWRRLGLAGPSGGGCTPLP